LSGHKFLLLNQDESGVKMQKFFGKRFQGFTLLELMITLVIVAILVALAYPAYSDYARKSRRGEAQQLLVNWSVNQEIWRSNHMQYADEDDLPVPTHEHFQFTVPVHSETEFVLQALALDDQANDKAKDGTACSTLNLNSAGRKYSGGDTSATSCWE